MKEEKGDEEAGGRAEGAGKTEEGGSWCAGSLMHMPSCTGSPSGRDHAEYQTESDQILISCVSVL